ncbi:MAG TPA: hypothetical protein VIU11_23390 [Nakamurella sp.]
MIEAKRRRGGALMYGGPGLLVPCMVLPNMDLTVPAPTSTPAVQESCSCGSGQDGHGGRGTRPRPTAAPPDHASETIMILANHGGKVIERAALDDNGPICVSRDSWGYSTTGRAAAVAAAVSVDEEAPTVTPPASVRSDNECS